MPFVYLERPQLHVVLHHLLVELSPDESLGIEDGVLWIGGQLVLRGVADQSLARFRSEGHVGWSAKAISSL